MPGRPFRREFLEKIKPNGGIPWLLERIANGETITAICKSLECSRGFLVNSKVGLLRRTPEMEEKYQEARKMGASALVEDGLRLVDEVREERDAVQKVRLQVEQRRYVAESLDRATYGQQNQPQVVLNVQALHLSALKAMSPSGPVLPVAAKQLEGSSDEAPA